MGRWVAGVEAGGGVSGVSGVEGGRREVAKRVE